MVFALLAAIAISNDPNTTEPLKQLARPVIQVRAQSWFPLPLPETAMTWAFTEDGFSTTNPPPFLRHMLKAVGEILRGRENPELRIKQLLVAHDVVDLPELNPCAWHGGEPVPEKHFRIGRTVEHGVRQRRLDVTWAKSLQSLDWLAVEPSQETSYWRTWSVSGYRVDSTKWRVEQTSGSGLSIYIGAGFTLNIEKVMAGPLTNSLGFLRADCGAKERMHLIRFEISLTWYPTLQHRYRIGYEFVAGTWVSIHRENYDLDDIWTYVYWGLANWREGH
jgi:hypothetical protein